MTASQPGPAQRGVETPGLVVLWTRDEPSHVGEVALLPAGDPGPWTFGRGEGSGHERRVFLTRQRPGGMAAAAPLACPRISRAQLLLSAAPGGGLVVENIGSCPLLHEGREVTRAELSPGDTLALRNEILFLCVRRGPIPAALVDDLALPLHAFGEPDAFGLVGESALLWDLRHLIVDVARKALHVLLLGASGSGKELVAQAIHARSAQSSRAMVSRNAATIPETLADAELFGNLRGYPNPGMPERPGLIGEAHESTLFLDEFAELPLSLQAHLLRVMDEGEYQRLGEAKMRRASLRIIGATSRSPSEIKHDILARFKVRIHLPDLNARREDIPLIVAHLLRRHAADDPLVARRFFPGGNPENPPLVSPVLIEALVKHNYTTNVRELDALLVRAALEGRGRRLEMTPDLRRHLHSTTPPRSMTLPPEAPPPEDAASSPEDWTQEELVRLQLLRRHHFSPTACGRDPAYPGNRQSADLHLRQLICRALKLADWDAERAAAVLAGDGGEALCDRAHARIGTFLSNLQARLGKEAKGELQRSLLEEWRGNAEAVLELVDALAAGSVGASGRQNKAGRET